MKPIQNDGFILCNAKLAKIAKIAKIANIPNSTD